MLELTLLGPPHALLSGARLTLRPRRLALLAYLALEGAQPRARLAGLLYPDLEPEDARGRLRSDLHRVLHSPLGQVLSLHGEEVALEGACDLLAFETRLRAGDFSGALSLCAGEVLEGLSFDDTPPLQGWLEARRQRHAQGHLRALEGRMAQLDTEGESEAALEVQHTLLECQPFAEAACDALTRRLEALGRRAEARVEQSAFQERFRREFGLEPLLSHALGSAPAALLPTAVVEPRPSLLEPPLVGREGLWAQLVEWYERTPRSRVVLLLGEGGVGKSRLAGAFAHWVDVGRLGGSGVPYMRAFESERGKPYGAALEVLRRAGAALADLAPAHRATLAPLLPKLFLRKAARTPPGEETSETVLFEALSDALLHISRVGPGVVTVFEDVHWLDASSVRLYAHTVGRLREDPLGGCFVCTARPGELRANESLLEWHADLEREGLLLRLEVPPLSEMSVLRLIRQLSGSPRATGFAQKLHALSGGNPYALLAFVQGLVSRGHLETHAPEGWKLHLELSELDGQLPLTLREVLLGTLERAGKPVLRLLEAAALRGQVFEFNAARAGSGLSDEQARAALERAEAHRWAQALPEGGYRLEHDLLRQTLEENLDADRARAVHLRLAQHLDEVSASSAARAHHWERGGRRARAFPLWKEVGLEAGKLWAHHEALGALERAIACTDDVVEQVELRIQRCDHLGALANMESWDAELKLIEAQLERGKQDPALWLQLEPFQPATIHERTYLLWRSGRFEEALAHTDPWTHKAHDAAGRAWVLVLRHRANLLRELNRAEEAHQLLRTMLERFEGLDMREEANLRIGIAQAAYNLAQPAMGLEQIPRVLELFRALDMKEGMASAYSTQALLFYQLGDVAAEESAQLEVLYWAREGRHIYMQRGSLYNLCMVMERKQNWSEGVRYATLGLELCEINGDRAGIQLFSSQLETLQDQLRARRAQSATQVQRSSG